MKTQDKFWDTLKTVPRRKISDLSDHTKESDRTQRHGLMVQPKEWEKQEQDKSKFIGSKRYKKTIKGEINEIGTKKPTQSTNGSKSWFFENINKIDRSLIQLKNRKKELAQTNNIRSEQANITTDSKEILDLKWENAIKNYYLKI